MRKLSGWITLNERRLYFSVRIDKPFPRSSLHLLQNDLESKTSDLKMIFHPRANATHFTTKVLQVASFSKWGFLELGNDRLNSQDSFNHFFALWSNWKARVLGYQKNTRVRMSILFMNGLGRAGRSLHIIPKSCFQACGMVFFPSHVMISWRNKQNLKCRVYV